MVNIDEGKVCPVSTHEGNERYGDKAPERERGREKVHSCV